MKLCPPIVHNSAIKPIRTLIAFLFAIIFTICTFNVTEARSYRSSPSDVYVRGYYRSDGTYVAPYYRSAPDGIISNNYGCIDDGKCGTSGGSSSGSSYSIFVPDPPTSYYIVDQKKTTNIESGYYNINRPYIAWFGASSRYNIDGYFVTISRDNTADPEDIDNVYIKGSAWVPSSKYFSTVGTYYILIKPVDTLRNRGKVVYGEYQYDPNGKNIIYLDSAFAKKLSGKFLVQVEADNMLWFVKKNDNKRVQIINAHEFSKLVKSHLTNMSNESIKVIQGKNTANKKRLITQYAGRFLRQSNGKTWYIDPSTKKMYSIDDAKKAFTKLKNDGVKISNEKILTIEST